MNEQRKTDDQRRSSVAVWLVIGLVVSPVAYFLSPGPVCWFINRGYISSSVMFIYRPLAWLAEHC